MKKQILCALASALLALLSSSMPQRQYAFVPYNAEAAVAYARAHVTQRDSRYPNLSSNCTNFVSQCLVAGGFAMDTPLPVTPGRRATIDKTADYWYSSYVQPSPEQPPCYRTSTAFTVTTNFVRYWTVNRGMPLQSFENTFSGRASLLLYVEPGDVVLIYAGNGVPAHLGLVTRVEATDAFYCANTNDRYEASICTLNLDVYPRFGVIKMQQEDL
ncbi:MAG: amidase domain-containing protein [Oscillospiraceae bacterium]